MANPFQKAVTALGGTNLGAWMFSRIGHDIDRMTFRLSGNRATLTSWMAGMPMVMVDVIGRKSGQHYLVPLMAIQRAEDKESFALIASNWGQKQYPAWYFNLLAQGEAEATIEGREARRYQLHEARDTEYQVYWETATRMLPNYNFYKKRIAGARPIPILVLNLMLQ
jgi:deazaflavin-dependent oxidoreductase (nitroreductase family)